MTAEVVERVWTYATDVHRFYRAFCDDCGFTSAEVTTRDDVERWAKKHKCSVTGE